MNGVLNSEEIKHLSLSMLPKFGKDLTTIDVLEGFLGNQCPLASENFYFADFS